VPTPTWARPIGTPTPDPPRNLPERGVITTTYTVRDGDTLSGVALATDTTVEELQRMNGLANPNTLQVGQQLYILRTIDGRAPSIKLIPDSELVNGPGAVDFDVDEFVASQRGYLNRYTQEVAGQMLTGAQIVQRVADQYSVHPRLLLALLEYSGGWVTNPQPAGEQLLYPLGYKRTNLDGLYVQLVWAASRLNEGYYGWRLGNRLYTRLDDGTYAFFGDGINAGTAGLQNYLSAISTRPIWLDRLGHDEDTAFIRTYRRLFGDAWQYDLGPPVRGNLSQPPLALPWAKGETWYFTGGPHGTWGKGTPWGALDFAPFDVAGCTELSDWVTAMSDGKIARSFNGEVAQSLDPSGDERIGWSLLYLHIGSSDRVKAGAVLKRGDHIGHPSCEGGLAEAAHVHLARKYNGEWINASGPAPFEIDGWVASEGLFEYEGQLKKGDASREACQCKWPEKNGVSW
jgi:murein DD-endopeptidase MepM/ murein hydrolase activator NlpD